MSNQHIPVLLPEVLEVLNLQPGHTVVDATLGAGGHARAFLEAVGPTGRLIGFDQDARNLAIAKQNLAEFGNQVTYVNHNFAYLKDALAEQGIHEMDAIFFDIGVSSMHFDDSERGFSFRHEGPLDMRMDTRNPVTAAMVVNTYAEKKIADIIYQFGEERRSRRIARAIVAARKITPFTTTTELANCIAKVIKTPQHSRIHPATKTFQAIRIYVNKELDVLEQGLDDAFNLLKKGGKIAVLSFHSLEDRIVKKRFKYWSSSCRCDADAIRCVCNKTPWGTLLIKKPIQATPAEAERNPRARSVRLRALEKIS